MWFHRRKQKAEKIEAQIQAIRAETDRAVEDAEDKTDKVNKLLNEGGTTMLIFLATGGGRRNAKR